MSEHIQPPPETHSREHERAHGQESTPGVSHESEAFAFRLILWVGGGLAVTVVVVVSALWFLLGGFERINTVPSGAASELALEEARKPFGQRLDDVPGPHLEGIERESSLLVVLSESGKEMRFYTAADIHVRIGANEKARLFELREGQRVTLAYYLPGGEGGGLGVVTSVTADSAHDRAEQKTHPSDFPDASRTLDGTIIRIEPRSINAARQWAEVQMGRYGWIDRNKEIVHVPIEKAMEEVLKSKEFRAEKKK
jgi:hypothetical protein